MPVFDFTQVKNENKEAAVTWFVFRSNESETSPEKPVLVLAKAPGRMRHHIVGVFTPVNKRTAFEFDAEDGVAGCDILRIDARFTSLIAWLGENHIHVRLTGEETGEGYAVYKIRELAFGGKGKLSAEDGFLQFMIGRRALSAPTRWEESWICWRIRRRPDCRKHGAKRWILVNSIPEKHLTHMSISAHIRRERGSFSGHTRRELSASRWSGTLRTGRKCRCRSST